MARGVKALRQPEGQQVRAESLRGLSLVPDSLAGRGLCWEQEPVDTQGGVLLVQRGLGVEWVVMEEQREASVQEGAGRFALGSGGR